MSNEIEKEETPIWEAPKLIIEFVNNTETPTDPSSTELDGGNLS